MEKKYRVVPLTRGFCAIVDSDQWRKINRFSWHTHMSAGTKRKPGQPYARTNIDGKKIYLHRFITGAYSPLHVDHANHQTLDCRRENLRVVDHITNIKNRRKRGVK